MLDARPSAWLQAGGIFIMVTLKIDCFAPAFVMGAASVAVALRRRCRTAAVLVPAAFLTAAACVCFMVWSYTGWFVPAPQYIGFLKGICS
jgi:hypothetical protein